MKKEDGPVTGSQRRGWASGGRQPAAGIDSERAAVAKRKTARTNRLEASANREAHRIVAGGTANVEAGSSGGRHESSLHFSAEELSPGQRGVARKR